MTQIAFARERVEQIDQEIEATVSAIRKTQAQRRELEAKISHLIDPAEVADAQVSIDRLTASVPPLERQVYAKQQERNIAQEALKSLELRRSLVVKDLEGAEASIAKLGEATPRLAAIKDELEVLKRGLPGNFISLVNDAIFKLLPITGAYNGALQNKVRAEKLLGQLGE